MLRWFVIMLMVVTGGCASLTQDTTTKSRVFELKKAVTIVPDTTRVFFQYGQIRSYNGVNWYDQWCALEVRALRSQPKKVLPGRYTIIKTRLDEMEVASNQKVQLAFAGGQERLVGLFYASESDSLPAPTMDVVHFYLQGEDKDVMRLTCGGALSDGRPADAPASYRPDIAAVNRILGQYGVIR